MVATGTMSDLNLGLEKHMENITASGPPLPVLLRSLEKLKDLRMAAPRDDIPTRYADFQLLRESLK